MAFPRKPSLGMMYKDEKGLWEYREHGWALVNINAPTFSRVKREKKKLRPSSSSVTVTTK